VVLSRSYRSFLQLKKRLPELWLFLQEAATVEAATPTRMGISCDVDFFVPLQIDRQYTVHIYQ
jgi:hypothetical protein